MKEYDPQFVDDLVRTIVIVALSEDPAPPGKLGFSAYKHAQCVVRCGNVMRSEAFKAHVVTTKEK